MDGQQLLAAFLPGFFDGLLGVLFAHYTLPAWHRWFRAKLWRCDCERCRTYRGET